MPRVVAAMIWIACLCSACGRWGYAQHQVEAAGEGATGGPPAAPNDPWIPDDASPTAPPEPRGPDLDAGAWLPDAFVPPSTPEAGQADTDAGTVMVTPDAGSIPCSGALAFGLCWYLGDPGASCNDTCATRDGVDPRTASFVGVPAQGGSPEQCQTIMRALGTTETVTVGYRNDGLGFGCHRWDDGVNWWIDQPAFDPAAAGYPAQVACACGQ